LDAWAWQKGLLQTITMITSRKAVGFGIVLTFLVSVVISNDLTPAYFIVLALFLVLLASLYRNQFKASFILSASLLVAYVYPAGLFFRYAMQDFIPNANPAERIMGYGAMGTLPFICLSLIAIWPAYKAYKTKKNTWYIGFICLIVLASAGGYEGYGSNYLLKLLLVGLSVLSFRQIRKQAAEAELDEHPV
jgi:general stress protein CsbA